MSYAKKAWANDDDVTPADFNRIEQGIADNAEQINILRCPDVDLPNNSLLEYVRSLPPGVHRTIQFSGATDTPTDNWYYAEIYTHSNGTSYFQASYQGLCRGGTFEGWEIAYGKEPFYCTPQTGWKINEQNCFTVGYVHYIDIELSTNDGSRITDTNAARLFSIPFTPTIAAQPLNTIFLNSHNGDFISGVFGHCNVATSTFCWLQACNTTDSTKIVRISGVLL